jgi:hypothetical protein
MEVVAQDLGAEVLLSRKPADAGQMFQGQPMLDAFASVLNTSSGVVQIAKARCGIRHGVG